MSDLWEMLKGSSLPILLYGMGNGADKILAVCAKKGIRVCGVFASDGFVRNNKLFHGMPVTDYQTAKKTFKDFTVLLSFASSREDVLADIQHIATQSKLLVPDVPVAGEQLFDEAFLTAHRSEFERARDVFGDEKSKRIFDLIIQCKMTGSLPLFFKETTDEDTDFRTLLHPEKYTVTGDLGAYTGDTAFSLLSRAPHITRIVAVEPDRKTYLKLTKNAENTPVFPVNGAAWQKEEPLTFTVSGNRGSGIGALGPKTEQVAGVTVDRLFQTLSVDYLKYDVEGAELSALLGSRETILRDRPEMLISCYHRPEDLYTLPLFIHEQFPFYKLYLRRHRGVPAWDINLYAVPE